MPLPETADELDAIMSQSRSGSGGVSGGHHAIPYGNGNGHGLGISAFPVHRDEFVSRENVSRVRHAIATLPDNYREVVVLCELDEMSYEDAAAALDCPVGTVRSRLHRARALLLEKLRDAQPMRRASAVGE